MLEFRESNQMMSVGPGAVAGGAPSTSDSFSRCRYCGAVSSTGDTVLNGVCGDKECVGHARNACQITLPCGHACGGIVDETECLPCLHGCAGGRGASSFRQDADDMCMVCFTDALWPIPSVQLECGHVFHYHCCVTVLEKRWMGPRITFGFRNCPICKAKIAHPALAAQMDAIDSLYDDVKKKSLM